MRGGQAGNVGCLLQSRVTGSSVHFRIVGGQQGAPPDVTQQPGPQPPKPTISHEVGTAEDTFELFLGGMEYPMDAAPIWRYMAKDALDAPEVRAVEQFRKAVADSEKQRKQKP